MGEGSFSDGTWKRLYARAVSWPCSTLVYRSLAGDIAGGASGSGRLPMERVTLILATLLLHAAVGDDLYWIPNTNWDNPSNWGLNRPPCSGEVANLASVSQGL